MGTATIDEIMVTAYDCEICQSGLLLTAEMPAQKTTTKLVTQSSTLRNTCAQRTCPSSCRERMAVEIYIEDVYQSNGDAYHCRGLEVGELSQ